MRAKANGPVPPEDSYEVAFPPGMPLAQRVIFPITPKQRHGLEDARFVRFVEDDGTVAYYATYTAYSGLEIAPELLRTDKDPAAVRLRCSTARGRVRVVRPAAHLCTCTGHYIAGLR